MAQGQNLISPNLPTHDWARPSSHPLPLANPCLSSLLFLTLQPQPSRGWTWGSGSNTHVHTTASQQASLHTWMCLNQIRVPRWWYLGLPLDWLQPSIASIALPGVLWAASPMCLHMPCIYNFPCSITWKSCWEAQPLTCTIQNVHLRKYTCLD